MAKNIRSCILIDVCINSIAVTIGFTTTDYSVGESDGHVSINVSVVKGSLQKEVIVLFSTSNLTAAGKIQSSLVQQNWHTIHIFLHSLS